MKLKKLMSIALVGVLMTSVLAGCGRSGASKSGDSDVIKLGISFALTGEVAVYGNAAKNGIELAVEEYNKNGGVLGKQIEVIAEDNKGNLADAANAFNKLVDRDHIDVFLGSDISGTTDAIAPLAVEKKIPMLSPTATKLDITTKYGEGIYRACFTDPYQGGAMGTFAATDLKLKNAAVLYNTESDYSEGLKDAFKEKFEAAGGAIVSEEGFNGSTEDFKAILTKIKETNPEGLFIPDYYSTVGKIVKQAKEIGLNVTFLGGDGWDGVLEYATAEQLEGSYFANHYAMSDPDENVQNFINAYKEKYDKDPTAFDSLGYDAAKIMIEAIKNAGSTDYDAVLKALDETNLTSVTGTIRFDENNNPIKSVSIIKIEDGKFNLFKKVEPEK